MCIFQFPWGVHHLVNFATINMNIEHARINKKLKDYKRIMDAQLVPILEAFIASN